MAAVVGAVPDVRSGLGHAVAGDTQAMRADLGGLTGALVILALAMAHVVVWFPAEILDAAAGLLYGFWVGFAIVHASWIASALAAYAVGRHLGRPALHRTIGGERVDRAEALVDRGGWRALIAARLIPIVPFSLFGFVAGAARVPIPRYTWTTAVGYVPITALSVLFGTRAEELSFTDPVLLASLGGLLVLLGASVVIGRRAGR